MYRVARPLALGAVLTLGAASVAAAPGAGDKAQAAVLPAEAGLPHAASDLPADPAVRNGMLPNGLRYAIRRNATPRGEASLRLRIDAGSLHESENQRGLAHFLEHMVLNGTTNVPEGEFVRILERHGLRFGPDTNASTGFTQTVFKLELPETDTDTVDTALFLLREVADEATLDAAAIESERGIILSEERTRSSPDYRILVDEIGYLLPGQILPNRLPIGVTSVISNAPRERLVDFYQAYYRPERATVVAVGDFDVDAMEEKIRARFTSWRGEGVGGADPELGTIASRKVEARAVVEPGGPERIAAHWVIPPDLRADTRATRAEAYARRIALQILNNRLSRIAATVSPPPFITARANRSNQADSAITVQVSASVRPGEWRKALETMEQEHRRLVEHGVSQAELDREITQMRSVLTTSVSRAATRHSTLLANALVAAVDEDEVFTAPDTDLAVFNQLAEGFTVESIAEAARDLFRGEGPLLFMSSAVAVKDAQSAMLAAFKDSRARAVSPPDRQQAVAWPYTGFGAPGAVVERRDHGKVIGATSVRFANGVWLTVRPTDFADNEVLVSVRTGDGRGNIPPGAPSPSWALGAGFVTGGLERISFEDLRETLSARIIGVQIALHDDSFTLNGRTRPQDFAVQMQVLAAYVAEPGWRPSGWDRLRSMSGTKHNKYESTPDGVYERDAAALLHGGDTRWATPTREQMAASSIDDARALIEDALAREPIEIVIVGDVTLDQAIAQTAATFGALPPRGPETDTILPVSFPAGTAEPVRLTHSGRVDQARAMIAWPTAGSLADSTQTRSINLLADVFKLRLTQRIREELGTSYSPAAMHVTSTYFDNFGFIFGRIEAPPSTLDGFLAEAAAIAADLRANPISADELQRARQPMIEGIERSRRSNIWWQFSLTGIHRDERVAQSILDQRRQVEAITAQSLRETARKFLRPDTAWKLVIVPEAQPDQPKRVK